MRDNNSYLEEQFQDEVNNYEGLNSNLYNNININNNSKNDIESISKSIPKLNKSESNNSKPSLNNILNIIPSIKSQDINKDIKKYYYCKNCDSFPLIESIDYNGIKMTCKEGNAEIKFDAMFQYRIIEINTIEEKEKFQKKFWCKIHNKNFECFCTKCNKNLCADCYNECNNNIEHNLLNNNEYNFKYFKKLDEEVNNKEKYIKKFFEKRNYKLWQQFGKKEKEIGKVKIYKTFGEIDKKNKEIEKSLENLKKLENLYQIFYYCKDNFPNYIHYQNIQNFFHLFISNKLEIEYYNYEDQSEKNIKIFGSEFVKKNKNNCHLIINEQKVDLQETYKIEQDKKLIVILFEDKPIKDMSNMFKGCDYLSCITENSNWNTDDVINMSSMFNGCTALKELPESFSDWNTSNVIDFSDMFSNCKCLKKYLIYQNGIQQM